jgi:hypothetical protein
MRLTFTTFVLPRATTLPMVRRPRRWDTMLTCCALRAGSAGTRVWFWTLRRGFSWFSIQAGLVAPIFLLELVLTNPSVRGNILAFLLLYAAGGGVVLVISVPYAARYGVWRSVLWAPTWFAFAFLRRIGTLEAAISLPVRPFPARPFPVSTVAIPAQPVPERTGPSGVSAGPSRP